MKKDIKDSVVCVIGVGYVGLPLVRAFGKELSVIGFDINTDLISRLQKETPANPRIRYTTDPSAIKGADYVIICVPTPVTEFKEPDLTPVIGAAETISRNLKPGATVILESTVYPGATEEVVVPILEKSGLKCGEGFRVAYSPERINPGDDTHSVEKMVKVVAGMDEETTDLVANLYSIAAPSTFKAKNIRTAEGEAKGTYNIGGGKRVSLNELVKLMLKMAGRKTSAWSTSYA